MILVTRSFLPAALLALVGVLSACSNDDGPTNPDVQPVLGLSASKITATAVTLSFNGVAGDESYDIERATGTGDFAKVGNVTAPTLGTSASYDDTGLTAETTYRYHVITRRGTRTATSTEISVTTVALGSFTRDVTTDITANTTWYADTTYILKGFIHVANGATLTIQPGTTIKGDFNTPGASLFVLRGSKINAIGTADLPIVFTSSRDAGSRQPGDWGGLIIVGNAPVNRAGVEIEVEGTNTVSGSASGTNYKVTYDGGSVPTDNSGELRYVRVEFAGHAASLDNELNSFTFAAVGSGTRLSYLQSMAGLDDSFEFFGGTVDAHHLVSYEAGDDHFDMSEGFRGRLQYLIALQTTQLAQRTGAGSPASDPQAIENDGCIGAGCLQGFDTTPFTTPIVANFTLVGTGDAATSGSSGGVGMMLRRGTGGYYVNGVVARFARAAVSVRDAETFARAGAVAVPDIATADLAVRNLLFVATATPFQGQSGGTVQNAFDLAGNALVENSTATLADVFTAFPSTVAEQTTADAFDWTPAASSPAASGGLATFTGKLATAGGSAVTGTSFVGAADPAGAKWWQGWTIYAQK
jgi:hypothetical protein